VQEAYNLAERGDYIFDPNTEKIALIHRRLYFQLNDKNINYSLIAVLIFFVNRKWTGLTTSTCSQSSIGNM
jgi:hypothetical protein